MQQVEPQIRQQWAKQWRPKDLAQIPAIYAPDIRAFDAVAKLNFCGLAAYQAHWQLYLSHAEAQFLQ